MVYRQELHKASPKLSNNRDEPSSTKYSSSKKQRLKTVPNVLNPQSPVFKEDVENPKQADIAAISQKVSYFILTPGFLAFFMIISLQLC